MRLILVSLFVTAAVSACSGRSGDNNLATVCAEQSALAQNGTTTGSAITITCPN
jgi:hypothetical protein